MRSARSRAAAIPSVVAVDARQRLIIRRQGGAQFLGQRIDGPKERATRLPASLSTSKLSLFISAVDIEPQ